MTTSKIKFVIVNKYHLGFTLPEENYSIAYIISSLISESVLYSQEGASLSLKTNYSINATLKDFKEHRIDPKGYQNSNLYQNILK